MKWLELAFWILLLGSAIGVVVAVKMVYGV